MTPPTSANPRRGWTATKTGSGSPRWTVEKDATAPSKANVLKQSGEATYPVCIKNDTSLKDGFVEVEFKSVSGNEDQAGGVIWRCKDADNYYIARANALEDKPRQHPATTTNDEAVHTEFIGGRSRPPMPFGCIETRHEQGIAVQLRRAGRDPAWRGAFTATSHGYLMV